MRIEPSNGPVARILTKGSRVSYGRELKSSGVYAKHLRLAASFMRYNRAAERTPHVPKLLAELGVAKAAAMVGCEFCIDISSEYVRRAGLGDEQLLALHEAHESGLFDEDQLLVIDLAEGMTGTPGAVSDELMARVVARFGDKGTLELVHLIGWENARARSNVALGVGPDGFSEGRACALGPRQVAAASGAARRGGRRRRRTRVGPGLAPLRRGGDPAARLALLAAGEEAHLAGDEATEEADRGADPADVGDERGPLQRAGAEGELAARLGDAAAEVEPLDVVGDDQQQPHRAGLDRAAQRRDECLAVVGAGQLTAGAEAERAVRHVRDRFDHRHRKG